MSDKAAFFCRTSRPVGKYFSRTLTHYCRTLSGVRRFFAGLLYFIRQMMIVFKVTRASEKIAKILGKDGLNLWKNLWNL